MNYAEYLEKYQPVAYKILKNSLESENFFHAYLLSGSTGTPLFEIAKFIAKSILCERRNPFCCDECHVCQRVEHGNFTDLRIIDGESEPIKKEDIKSIIDTFSMSASEERGIKVYVIHLIENMRPDAINALLKFLEEPPENTYAIFTTENKYRILETILSRCEIINLTLLDQKVLIEHAVKLGCAKEDAELLSFFYNDSSMILDVSKSNDYSVVKEQILALLKVINDKDKYRFILETVIIPNLKTKEEIRLFFDNVIVFFKEALKYSINRNTILTSYVNIIRDLVDSSNKLDDAILTLIDARNELNFNLIPSLLILNAFTKILEV